MYPLCPITTSAGVISAILLLSWQQVALDGKHLPTDGTGKPINLPRALLNLPRIEEYLKPARLLRELEQSRPFVLGKQGLLRSCACCILGLALLLPLRDLGLLARQRSLIVLVIVELDLVVLDAVEE